MSRSRKSRHTIRIHVPTFVVALLLSTVIGTALSIGPWPALAIGLIATYGTRALLRSARRSARRSVRKVVGPRRRHIHF